MKILKKDTPMKITDSVENYEWLFCDNSQQLYIWFNDKDIMHFIKYIHLHNYDRKLSNLFRNSPDRFGNIKRGFVGPMTTTLIEQLKEHHGQQKESVLNFSSETRNLQVETEKRMPFGGKSRER